MVSDKKNKKTSGLMQVLQVVSYKDGNILIRKFPKDMYVWDIFYKGQFYSSYIVVTPLKGEKDISEAGTAVGFGTTDATPFFTGTVSSVAMNTASLKFGIGLMGTTGTTTLVLSGLTGVVNNMN